MRISHWLRNLYSGFKTGFKESLPPRLIRNRRITTASRVEPLEERWLLANWVGDIPNGTVWPAGQVQRIVGDVHIPAGSTLTIQAGAVVKFNEFANLSINVDGTLLAQGTAGQPIYFTSLRDDTVGGDTLGNGPQDVYGGQWSAVAFSGSSTGNVLDHVELRYGGENTPGSLVVNGGQLTLTNSTLMSSSSSGVRIQNSNPTLTNVIYKNNLIAASMDLNSNPAISGVTMTNNATNALLVDGGTMTNGGTWNDPNITYLIQDGITVPAGKTLSIAAGQVVKFREFGGFGITVNGTLAANGTSGSPIYFTSTRDDSVGGDTYNNGANDVYGGQWDALTFNNTSSGNVLDHVEVRYGGENGVGGVIVNGGPLALTNSTLQASSSSGIRILNSNPTLTNIIYKNNLIAASMDLNSNPVISGVTMTNNATNALRVDGGTMTNGGTWNDPNITYLIQDGITVPAGKILSIAAGQVVKFREFGGFGITVNGTLAANGTTGAPIYFTSSRDDSVGGDARNDGPTDVYAGQWDSLTLNNTSLANVLDHVEVRYGGENGVGGVIVNGGPLALTNSTLQASSSSGIRILNSNPTLTNIIYKNNLIAASMDLNSNPAISGVTMTNNATNALLVDGGTMTNGGTWNDPNITYLIQDGITVPAGKILSIAAGQVVKFREFGNFGITVNGTLAANGTTGAPIYFTSSRDDSVGGDARNDGPTDVYAGQWDSLTLNNTSLANVLDHVEVRYGGENGIGAVITNGGALSMTDSTIQASSTSGIRIQNSSPTLTNLKFKDNSIAASMDLASNPAISGVTMINNGTNALRVDGGTMTNGGTWNDPDITYLIQDGITVPTGKTLSIAAGQVVKFREFGNFGITVNGTLAANGTTGAPIYFTSSRDDTVGGDAYNNGMNDVYWGQWDSLTFNNTSLANVLDHVEVRYGGENGIGAVITNGGALSMTDSTIQASSTSGIRIQNSSPTLTNLKFKDNSIAASMDLASNPAISGVIMINNGTNALRVDGGTMTNGGTWNDPDITYLIQDGITVPTGKTLSIAAGQVVKFREFGNFGITVNGTLAANGTLTAPIYFTSSRDDTVGGDAYNNGMNDVYGGQWDSLTFNNTSLANVLDHVELRYGGENGAATVIANGTLLDFTNGVIRNSSANAFQVKSGATLNLANSVIFNNADTGLRVESGSTASAVNNTIDGNFRGAVVDGASTVLVLTNSLVTNSIRAGITLTNRGLATTGFNDVFNPTASEGNYNGLANVTGTNGNVSVDPKYVNRASLDFHLQVTSPVIDAATSDNAPIDDFDFNYRIDNLATPNTGDGASPFFDMGAYEFGGKPRAVKHFPSGNVAGVISKILFTFRGAMDTTSFSVATDVISFTGPTGPLTVTGYQWLNQYQLEVAFNEQSKAGDYELVLGPGILDKNGSALDTDGDGVRGENTDDRYSANWTIVPPRIVAQTPRDYVPAPIDHITVVFDRPMDQQSFALADDLISFKGPDGNIQATGFSWIDSRTLQVSFASQTTLGAYEMVLGPNIADVGGNLLDQNRDGVVGGNPSDRYTVSFQLANILFVSGSITQNTTWGGLIIVDDDVTVQSGVTLTINPGTIVKLRDLTGIKVEAGATLLSNGTTAQPVRITSIHDDTIGGDSDQNGNRIGPQAGNWGQILNLGNATFDHTQVLYGSGIGNTALNSGAIHNSGGTLIFSNSLLSDAFYDGLDSVSGTVTITNSVFTGADRAIVSTFAGTTISIVNSTFDNNRIGLLAHVGGMISLKNSIVANSLEAGFDTEGSLQTVSYSDVFTTVPNAVNYRGMTNQTGTNGNISKDPKFMNSAGGNYRLSFFSPAIDAANGTLASPSDINGAPRFDAPGTANTGVITAAGSFADMGAYEFVEGATSSLDLIVTSVAEPVAGTSGSIVTVGWSAKNIGTEVVTGDWNDGVYLSTDSILSADDLLLGQYLQSGPLGPNQSYAGLAKLTLPILTPGDYYFLVRTNSNDAVFEGQNRENNTLPADTATEVSVNLQSLALNTPLSGQFDGSGDFHYYQVTAPAHEGFTVTLDSQASDGGVEMFLGVGRIPTTDSFDFRSSLAVQPDPTLTLPSTAALVDTYYLLVRAKSGAASRSAYLLTVAKPGFQVSQISPQSAGNSGEVTISISGTNLTVQTQVTLVPQGAGGVLTPLATYFQNDAQLFATFDLTGIQSGAYDVHVISKHEELDQTVADPDVHSTLIVDGDVTLPGGFQVVAGGGGHVTTQLVLPSSARAGRVFPFQLEVVNDGTNDVPAPLVIVKGLNGTPVSTLPTVSSESNTIEQILVLGTGTPRAVLRPGDRISIPLYGMASTGTTSQLEVRIASDSSGMINWDALESLYRDDSPVAEWNVTWTNFKSLVGNTFAQLNAAMRLSAEDLADPTRTFFTGADLVTDLLGRAQLGLHDASGFFSAPNGGLVIPEIGGYSSLASFLQSSPRSAALLAAAVSPGGIGNLPPTDHSGDGGGDYRPPIPGTITAAKLWLNNVLIPYLRRNYGEEVANLWLKFISGTPNPTREQISDPNSQIIAGANGAKGYRDSVTSEQVARQIMDRLHTAILTQIKEKKIVPENLPSAVEVTKSISDFLDPKLLSVDGLQIEYNAIPGGAAFNLALGLSFDKPPEIPGNTAGGIGGSDHYGADKRTILGSIKLFRLTDTDGNTVMIGMESDFTFVVDDAIDFLPGDLGTYVEQAATRPLKRLEANDQAFDVPFTVTYKTNTHYDSIPGGALPENWHPKKKKEQPPADPAQDSSTTGSVSSVNSHDPNDIVGPAGVGSQHWLLPTDPLLYTIHFENDPVFATAAAQDVTVTNTLDADVDLSTFAFGSLGFGTTVVEISAGSQSFSKTVETTNLDGTPLLVSIEASLNFDTRVITWEFRSLDPQTLLPPFDPEAGFLPPNNATHRGEGFVTYTVHPKSALTSGTRIDNGASIVFDINDPLATNAVFNTIDAGSPSSSVTSLPSLSSTIFTVRWSGNDDAGGSGIGSYDIYVSDNNGPDFIWQSATTATSATYTGIPGHAYRFYSVAHDNVGHAEIAPLTADTATTVETNTAPQILPSQAYNVLANAANGTNIGTVIASDVDITSPNNSLSFSITSGNGSGAFLINPATGQIQVANSTALTLLGGQVITLQVTVIDGGSPPLSASQNVSVTVTNVNTPPVLGAPGTPPTFIGKLKTPVPVLPALTVTDVDGAASLASIVISLTFGGKKKNLDTVTLPGFAALGTRSDSVVAGRQVITITLRQGTTNAAVQQMLQGLTFQTKGAGLKIPSRNFQVRVTDRTGLQSNLVTQNITVRKK